MNTIIKVILCIISTTLLNQVIAQNQKGFTLEQSKKFHYEYTFQKVLEGGELARYYFLNQTEFGKHEVINKSGIAKSLPKSTMEKLNHFITKTQLGELSLQNYIEASTVDGLIILHEGRIVFEKYPRMFEFDKHKYNSITKTFISTAIAILEDRGQIDVLQSIDHFFPELKETAWEGVTIIDILDMSSGIDWNRSYQGGLNNSEDPIAHIGTLEMKKPSGQSFTYANINTIVLTWLVERITNMKISDFLEQEIWQKIGAEADAILISVRPGMSASYMGMSSTLRDLARYGLLFTPSGRQDSIRVVSDNYLQKIQTGGRPELLKATEYIDLEAFDIPKTKNNLVDGEPPNFNTYQWDVVMKDGDFFKGGWKGQGLYISPSRDLVIAYFGHYENEMARISRQLAKSRLFNK